MADINKTIEISYRAETKNLVRGLEKVGKTSEKEAKEIVRNLDKAYTKASNEAIKSGKKQERALDKVATKAKLTSGTIKKSFTALGVAAAAASVAVLAFGQHIADMSNQLVDSSTKTGVSVETLNGLRLAAEGAGLSFEELETGLLKLPQMMQLAADGSKKAQKAFENLGVETTKTVDGFEQLRTADEVLKEVFISLQKITSAEEKAARAAEVFGRTAGPKFIQSGAIDNLEAFVSLANEYGISSGPRMQETMANFQRTAATATTVVQGEILRLIDIFAGREGSGGQGLIDIILFATKSFIFFGAIVENTMKAMNNSVQMRMATMNVLLQNVIGTAEDVERANQVLNEIGFNISNNLESPLAGAISALDRFDEKYSKTLQATTGQSSSQRRVSNTNQSTKPDNKHLERASMIADFIADMDARILKTTMEVLAAQQAELSGDELLVDKARQKLALILEEEKKIKEKIELIKKSGATEDEIYEANFAAEDRLEQLQQKRADVLEELQAKRLEAIAEEGSAVIDQQATELEERLRVIEEVRKMWEETDKERAKRQKEINAQAAMVLVDNISTGISLSADLLEAFGQETKKNEEIAFGIRKAAAIADVIIQTAKNVVSVAPLGPVAMSAMGAIGAAQFAIIASQQPKFHMGGMIGDGSPLAPDEKMVRAKNGEAILSTAAVNRLGKSGIQALENGATANQTIIVTNPFKHYDRFIQGRKAIGLDFNGTGRKGY